jgi:hypothetical protein
MAGARAATPYNLPVEQPTKFRVRLTWPLMPKPVVNKISVVIEISIDLRVIFPYLLKYEKA